MEAHGIGHELSGHRPEAWIDTEVVVKSPGIPDDAPIVDTCRAQGREVISDIEYASRVFVAQGHTTPVVAVTGANGKTTTTSMIDHVLRHEGWDVDCVGNIGTSWSRRLAERHEAGDAAAQATVIEVSSFQLDGTSTFSPDVAVLLNITPDHLDRYGNDMASYAASKWRITQAQRGRPPHLQRGLRLDRSHAPRPRHRRPTPPLVCRAPFRRGRARRPGWRFGPSRP